MKLVEAEAKAAGGGQFKLTHYQQPERRSLYATSDQIVGNTEETLSR